MLTYTQVYTLSECTCAHTLGKRKKKRGKKNPTTHIPSHSPTDAQTSRQLSFFFFFLFNTDESKIHPHFHSEEGEMAPLNTARLGDLSPSLGLTYKHIFAHLLLPFLTLSSSRPSLLFPARVRFPTVSRRNCTAYSVSLTHTHTHTHNLSVFKLCLSFVCARLWDRVCVCVRARAGVCLSSQPIFSTKATAAAGLCWIKDDRAVISGD